MTPCAAGVPVVMGTDAGNPLTLHGPSVYAEMEATTPAGLRHAGRLAQSGRPPGFAGEAPEV